MTTTMTDNNTDNSDNEVTTTAIDRASILETFENYGTPKPRWRIGGEFERAVVRRDGSAVGYDDPNGIRWILHQLIERQGWTEVCEGDNPIALLRNNASITLEPGGAVELSGAPHRTLAELDAEMNENRDALLDIAEGHDLVWTAAGVTPVATVDSIKWMPKGRYKVMGEYLPTKGKLAVHMMKATASVQCNYDYRDEADAIKKVRLCAGVGPLTTAIFSNSPLYGGKPTGFMSYRGHIWTKTDPDRCGFPPSLRSGLSHGEGFSFERWVDYLLDVPMIFVVYNGNWLNANGLSFREYMTTGFVGPTGVKWPNWSDWELHMTSVFPEVRIKKTIEVRGADCVRHDLALAFCAMFTGLLYCEGALDEGLQLISELEKNGDYNSRFNEACRNGMHGNISGRSIVDWASDLGDIADLGLSRCLPRDRSMLAPLLEYIENGRSPADDLLDAFNKDPSPENLVQASKY